MAIQRLTAFTAEADIFGKLRRVRFDADTHSLSIECIGVDEAATIIDYLSTGDLKSTTAGSLPVAVGMPDAEKDVLKDNPIEAAPEDPQSAPPKKKRTKTRSGKGGGRRTTSTTSTRRSSAAAKTVEKADPDEPKGSPSPGQVEAAAEEIENGSVTDDVLEEGEEGYDYVSAGREFKEEQAQAETSKKAVAASKGGAIPDELKKAKKLRDVVGYIYEDMQITHPDAIMAKCEEIQQHVPCLKRIKGSLKERVARTMEVLKIGE